MLSVQPEEVNPNTSHAASESASILLAKVEQHCDVLFTPNSTPSQLKVWVSQNSRNVNNELEHELPPKDQPESLLQTDPELESLLQTTNFGNASYAQTIIFLISQKNTWSRMQISHPVFVRLAVAFKMPPDFSELLSTFGHKTTDTDGVFQSCFSCFQEISLRAPLVNLQDQLYIFYNIRYLELNGRGGKNPWSFRNFGVLHSLRPSSGESSWLLISIPPAVRDRLKQQVNDDNHNQILWHAYLLGAMLHNWRFYINFLAEQYQEISTSILIFSFSMKNKTGPTFDLTTSERLRTVHTQAHKALCILRSYGNVCQGILAHKRGLRQHKLIGREGAEAMNMALRRLTETTAAHICQLEGLLKSCEFTAQTLYQLQNTHSIAIVQDNLQNLDRNLADSALQQQSLVSLSRRLSQDSGITRLATVVSLAYASAGLVAALFNSNLVQTSSAANNFTVNQDMWIFVLTALSFTFLTMLGVWFLETGQKRKLKGIQ